VTSEKNVFDVGRNYGPKSKFQWSKTFFCVKQIKVKIYPKPKKFIKDQTLFEKFSDLNRDPINYIAKKTFFTSKALFEQLC
jgi:hypothetical protein